MRRADLLRVFLAALTIPWTCLCWSESVSAADRRTDTRPNIVFILMDDLRWDELACTGHPFVKTPHVDRLAREGALFRNAFATTPLCSPSRASILTGLYPHTHGVTDNTNHDALSHRLITFLLLLKRAGYATAFIGKWHMGTDATPRPGNDEWVGFKGQGKYLNPELNINGKDERVTGYATDILNARAVEFIKRPHDRPFVLYLSHKACHPNLIQHADGSLSDPSASEFIPAERHKLLYADARIPRRPNALIDRLEGKPALMRKIGNLPPLSRATGSSDDVVRGRLRTFMAAEEGVGQILKALEERKLLDRTLIIFTSDQKRLLFMASNGLSVSRPPCAKKKGARIPPGDALPAAHQARQRRGPVCPDAGHCPDASGPGGRAGAASVARALDRSPVARAANENCATRSSSNTFRTRCFRAWTEWAIRRCVQAAGLTSTTPT